MSADHRCGIVDLGSNTARLVVYAFQPGRWFRLVDEIREPVRLGEDVAGSGRLTRPAIDRAVAALRLYADYARATGLARPLVIATSAVRDAANSKEILSPIAELDLEVEVLSGQQEAYLGALAVANSSGFSDAWAIDLGGGSCQISRFESRHPTLCQSFPLGGVRLTESFLGSNPPTRSELARLEKELERWLEPLASEVRRSGLPLVGMGGTLRDLARAHQKETRYPLDMLHGYWFETAALQRLVEKLAGMAGRRRARVPGIHPDRADVILAGGLVFAWLLRRCNLPGIWISGQGVREGALYRRLLPEPHLVPDLRRFSLGIVFEHFPQPVEHVDRVRFLSRRLFDELAELHGYGDAEAELLDSAALLHDAGMNLGYFDHHKHGSYLLQSAPLPGFSHRELALLCLLVRHHRKGRPRARELATLLEPDDGHRLDVLCSCLQLAEQLERSRSGRVLDLEVDVDTAVTLTLVAKEEPKVELWEAAKQGSLFRRAFDRPLRLGSRVVAA